MNLAGRLAALERHAPCEVIGYQVTRTNPDGAVVQEFVLVSGHRPGMATRYYSVAGFAAAYPAGRIVKQLILEDDGRAPEPGSLAATWRDVAVER